MHSRDCPRERKDKITLGLLANGGDVWTNKDCECDPETGHSPCRYCAIHNALIYARSRIAELEAQLLCDCSCGDPCPLGKTGMSQRCTLREVIDCLKAKLAMINKISVPSGSVASAESGTANNPASNIGV